MDPNETTDPQNKEEKEATAPPSPGEERKYIPDGRCNISPQMSRCVLVNIIIISNTHVIIRSPKLKMSFLSYIHAQAAAAIVPSGCPRGARTTMTTTTTSPSTGLRSNRVNYAICINIFRPWNYDE